MTSSTAYTITPRKVSFDWDKDQQFLWIPGDDFGSHWGNCFHYLLTEGEKFFCRAFREALPHITDDKLREDVTAFIRQEAIHSNAHHQALANILEQLNIEGGLFARQNTFLFDKLLAEKPFGKTVPKFLQYRWLVIRVGIVATVEHFTAALGAYLVEETKWDEQGANPVIADLYRWHGAEEVEHRCVAYDLYKHLGGGWLLRTFLMLLVFPLLMERQITGIRMIAKQTNKPFKFWQGWRASIRKNTAPNFTWFFLKALRFLKPSYNPLHEASTEAAMAYLENSMAVKKALNN